MLALTLSFLTATGCIAPLVAPPDHFGATAPRIATADDDWRGQATANLGLLSSGVTAGGGWSPSGLRWMVLDADALASGKRVGLAPGVWLRAGDKDRKNNVGFRLGVSGGVGDQVGKVKLMETTWYGGSLRLQYATAGEKPGAAFAITGGGGFSKFLGDVPEVYDADFEITDAESGETVFSTDTGLLIPFHQRWFQLGLQGSFPLSDKERPTTLEVGVAGEVQIWITSDLPADDALNEDAALPWLTPQVTLGLGF